MTSVDQNLTPEGELTLQLPATGRDTNVFGDVHGGWIASQVVAAAETRAAQIAKGRVATVSIGSMDFVSPVLVGTLLSFYTSAVGVGNTSINLLVEVWGRCPDGRELRKITETQVVQVAIDEDGHIRPLPQYM